MKIKIPVSIGELVDKITILEIKSVKIKDGLKRKHVMHELGILQKEYDKIRLSPLKKRKLELSKNKLLRINKSLWEIEDKIRKLEQNKNFKNGFIRLARSVYFDNDKRFQIKNEINNLLGSAISEVKEYVHYAKSR